MEANRGEMQMVEHVAESSESVEINVVGVWTYVVISARATHCARVYQLGIVEGIGSLSPGQP